jgi:hypothetical protein
MSLSDFIGVEVNVGVGWLRGPYVWTFQGCCCEDSVVVVGEVVRIEACV